MTSPGVRVAVVGATGLVGSEIISLLEERNFPVEDLLLYASDRSQGETVEFCGDRLSVKRLPDDLPSIDVAFLAATTEVSERIAAPLVTKGTLVIDLTACSGKASELAGTPGVRVPSAGGAARVVTIPNPLARMVAAPLGALAALGALRHAVVTLLVSASAFGRERVEELGRQTASLLNAEAVAEGQEEGGETLAFACIPEVGPAVPLSTQVAEEIPNLLATRFPVMVSVVRTPTFFAHAASIAVEIDAKVSLDEVRKALREAPSVIVADQGAEPIGTRDVVGGEAIYVAGLREDASAPGWLQFWAMADNVRQGSALAAVSLAEGYVARRGQTPGKAGG